MQNYFSDEVYGVGLQRAIITVCVENTVFLENSSDGLSERLCLMLQETKRGNDSQLLTKETYASAEKLSDCKLISPSQYKSLQMNF